MSNSSSTVAILLGASHWPRSLERWQGSACFQNSKIDFQAYLRSKDGLNLSKASVLDLFDDARSADDIDSAIELFLGDLKDTKNVIVYYVGHGAFTEGDRRYCLALRSTRINALGQSGYRVSSMARTLGRTARNARKFVVIDACYASAAEADFLPQSHVGHRVELQMDAAIADSGIALLCATSAAEIALAPITGKYTMFSGAMIEALSKGAAHKPALLSLHDVRSIADFIIREQFKDEGIAPELHVPDQRRGDISRFGLFPNQSFQARDKQYNLNYIETRAIGFYGFRQFFHDMMNHEAASLMLSFAVICVIIPILIVNGKLQSKDDDLEQQRVLNDFIGRRTSSSQQNEASLEVIETSFELIQKSKIVLELVTHTYNKSNEATTIERDHVDDKKIIFDIASVNFSEVDRKTLHIACITPGCFKDSTEKATEIKEIEIKDDGGRVPNIVEDFDFLRRQISPDQTSPDQPQQIQVD